MRSDEVAIEVNGLTKRFGRVPAVSGLTFQVRRGEVMGFLGPNGSGKTTTIRTAMGFLNPDAGSCSVLGASLRDAPALRRRVGYLPGDFRADPGVTARDLFRWFAGLRGGIPEQRIARLCERMQLDPTRKFATLSKGNRQKVGIIQAFMQDPDVLVLDEPTTGLDPLLQREFLGLVGEAKTRGGAVLFSSHVLSEVERAASRVTMIRSGELVSTSAVSELLDRARHHMAFHYAAPVDASDFVGVPGVVQVEVDGGIVTVTVDGPCADAVRIAAAHRGLVRVTTSDDLEEMFVSVYNGPKR